VHRRSPLLALALVMLAAGCGGGESDEDRIADAIRVSATSESPSACTERVTLAFLEQTEFAQGQEAVEACREGGGTAKAVEVDRIEVDGESATADAAFEGSSFDGQTVAVALVKDGEDWRLDRITGFREFDKSAFLDAYRVALTTPPDELRPAQAGCIVGLLGRSPEEKLEKVLLSGDPKPLRALFALCG
jgi:hypothetical protein